MARSSVPSAVWNYTQSNNFSELDNRHQQIDKRLWAPAIQPRRQFLNCTVGGKPTNHSNDSENVFEMSLTWWPLKEINTYRCAKSIDLILKSIMQVLSTNKQCNNDRRYQNQVNRNAKKRNAITVFICNNDNKKIGHTIIVF